MIIEEQEHRELWLIWSIELMRRGLILDGDIEVHGPHDQPGDLLWGEAWCKNIDGMNRHVTFSTSRGKTSKYDAPGVKVEGFPVLPGRNLPAEWRVKIRQMKQKLGQLRAQSF